MPDGELFEDIGKTRHAGASPWERYVKAKGGAQPVKIGWLTAQLPDDKFAALVRYAERRPDWRERLIEAIDGICSL